ncbi:MAG: phage tail protein [Alteripontixanthobacter sp.]
MATLILSTVGSAIGGPIGSAIGAFAGSQIDNAIFGNGSAEGPRLKELAITTSSYGQPLSRHHGRVRAPGTIIWATDLAESRESSGGKGKPKTTTFSYSTSFAVALASRPIGDLRQIWADGNLLRGEAGDLKVGGTLRIHSGRRDQMPDPLIAGSEGATCPAFRGCAYVVFEDLQLAEFGNRIPALTFEVVADDGSIELAQMVTPLIGDSQSDLAFPELTGFSFDGGPLSASLATIDQVYPLAIDAGGDRLTLSDARQHAGDPVTLPPAASAWEEGDFGGPSGRNRQRDADEQDRPQGLRYYDTSRDYQPGLQRAEGRHPPGRSRILEFPGSLDAGSARGLVSAAAQRASWRRERLSWRLAELDPALGPGTIVRVPGVPGHWRIASWEWRTRGVELELDRLPPIGAAQLSADAGQALPPLDDLSRETFLEAFELPWDGIGASDTRAIFAAASAGGPGWNGASIFTDIGGELQPLTTTGRVRSTLGKLANALPPSPSMLFDPGASISVDVAAPDTGFSSTTMIGLARGANRLLIGSEVLQFAVATQTNTLRWRLSGLLRGRGGTEYFAQSGHPIGERAVLLDNTLIPLDPLEVPAMADSTLAAIGNSDREPVFATIADPGATLRPLAPVHPFACALNDGSLDLRWTRRARGAWDWPDEVDAPLVEQSEAYLVGLGAVESPARSWQVSQPSLHLGADEMSELRAAHSGQSLWVRQVGSHAKSRALLLTTIV